MSASAPTEAKQWSQQGDDVPWFDHPDGHRLLEEMSSSLSPEVHQYLKLWLDQGYFVADGFVDEADIDQMTVDLDAIWTTDEPIEGMRIEEIKRRPDDPPGLSHAELVQLSLDERTALRHSHKWFVHGFHLHSEATRRIFQNQRLTELCSLVLGKPAEPSYTINFMYGSRKAMHQDSPVFHIHPANNLVGLWLACEDISEQSGPLVYYPGSHKTPMFDHFHNYPQTNLRTCPPAHTEEYIRWLDELTEGYEQHSFIAKKGQLLFWHGMLIHGGGEVINPQLTRNSYVCHYVSHGTNKHHDVVGPFNW